MRAPLFIALAVVAVAIVGMGGVMTQQPEAAACTPAAAPGPAGSFTIKGVPADAEQRRNVAVALREAARLHAPPLAVLGMNAAGIAESSYRAEPNAGGSNYWGVWQGSKNVWRIDDVAGMADAFLGGGKGFQAGGAIKYARGHPGASPGEVALRVEGSLSNFGGNAAAGAAFYDAFAAEARAIAGLPSGAAGACLDAALSGSAADVVRAADQLDAMRIPYNYAGGHVTPARPTAGQDGPFLGLDCSSAVSWVLQHARLLGPTLDSGHLMAWGEPGAGRAVTIFANPTHVFMRVGSRYFGTSNFGHPLAGTGPAWFVNAPPASYLTLFTQRHPKGM